MVPGFPKDPSLSHLKIFSQLAARVDRSEGGESVDFRLLLRRQHIREQEEINEIYAKHEWRKKMKRMFVDDWNEKQSFRVNQMKWKFTRRNEGFHENVEWENWTSINEATNHQLKKKQ